MKSPIKPFRILDDFRHRLAANPGVGEIRVLGGGMLPPDGHVGHFRHMDAGLFRKLALGTWFSQAGHGKKAVGGNAARIVHGNKGIRIAGVADHQHAHILGGAAGNGLPLADEHLAVDIQQVLAFIPGLAGERSLPAGTSWRRRTLHQDRWSEQFH